MSENMVQITETSLGQGLGVSTVEEHEVTTWPVIANPVALAKAPGTTNRDLTTILAYVKSIHTRRGKQ